MCLGALVAFALTAKYNGIRYEVATHVLNPSLGIVVGVNPGGPTLAPRSTAKEFSLPWSDGTAWTWLA